MKLASSPFPSSSLCFSLVMFLAGGQDELEITSRVLGRKGAYTGTIVLLKNRRTGEMVAEGRHSMFGKLHSSI